MAELLAPNLRPELLTQDALLFLARLHEAFEPRRKALLEARVRRQRALDSGALKLDFLAETRSIREGSWRVTPPPADLADRRVEITGPAERRMMIHALNSGAKVFMADFEDALSPTWRNLLDGQANLLDAVRGTLTVEAEGRKLAVKPDAATLVVRPRGLHLAEPRVTMGGQPLSASLFDFGLFAFHCARGLQFHGSGPYLYLPKLESHLEARLWNDVFTFTEEALDLPRHAFRATVLIETLPAAFEMEEILYELRERSPALNAGRWDYLFSTIKTMRARSGFVLPDRSELTMTTPFMWAYAQLLVTTCHKRGAYAIGGMAAYVPSRRDPGRNEVALRKVREDKLREAKEGFDGTWVAHPDLVPVALDAFGGRSGDRTKQEVRIGACELLFHHVPSAAATEGGLRANVRVALAYLSAWLGGQGAVAIDSLMEDTATAEIARTQVWQWVRNGVVFEDARTVTSELVRSVAREELARLRVDPNVPEACKAHLDEARHLFDDVALASALPDFLTLAGMQRLRAIEEAAA